ncbi:hypothetical protein AKJ38_03180 [candidate division MSBL1 archaeon SCGC-AAA259I14]|uniref:DUF429 domain-containing protein n=1 Tax=candidate division MSBL1 archaeon SCGC-AAA259I14 TaxID=1698268 RepID=A0A133UQI0_9EURY|nr:hypothetical protein AKJ38_03180 [candidate division MSBL1 archaeon SCGC-AAA259I14]
MKTIGIDLSGKEENPTGIAILRERYIESDILYSTEHIVERCQSEKPDIVGIDAPLSAPEGGGFRSSDRMLIERGYRVLPPTFGGMKILTERGIRLAGNLRELGYKVIEVHPLTSGLILFNTKSRNEWVSNLLDESWDLDLGSTDHEIDSAIAAITGLLYLMDRTEEVGEEDDLIIIPSGNLQAL